MSNFKGTKGVIKRKEKHENGFMIAGFSETGLRTDICEVFFYDAVDIETTSNIQLIIDAFNVRQRINCELSDLIEILKETAENLSLQLQLRGVCGEGDGVGRKADSDSYGGVDLLHRIHEILKNPLTNGKQL